MSLLQALADAQRDDSPLLQLREVAVDGLHGQVREGALSFALPGFLALDAWVTSPDTGWQHVQCEMQLPANDRANSVSTKQVDLLIDEVKADSAEATVVRYDPATRRLTIALEAMFDREEVTLAFVARGGGA